MDSLDAAEIDARSTIALEPNASPRFTVQAQTAVSEELVRLAGADRPVSNVVSRRQVTSSRRVSRSMSTSTGSGRVSAITSIRESEPRRHRKALSGSVMKTTARFDARTVRDKLLKARRTRRIWVHPVHAYRPFDNRWLYWEKDTKLLDEKRLRLQTACVREGICGSAAQ